MLVFLVIGAVGIAVLVLSLLLGDLFNMEHLNVLDSEFFSTAGLAGFIGAFGFGGAIALEITQTTWMAVAAGGVLGVLVGWLAGWLTAKLKAGQSGSAPATASIMGAQARVISAIPDAGFGEIRVMMAGHPLKLNAKSDQPLAQGTRVWVSNVLSPTAVHVTPIDPIENDDRPELPA